MAKKDQAGQDEQTEQPVQTDRSEEAVAREGLLIQSPGPEETEEQGLIRTGRKLPAHPGGEDSAGLTPDATAVRVEHTHAQRDETHRVTTEQGHRADGDAPAGDRELPRT
jgi:hypothetical protein